MLEYNEIKENKVIVMDGAPYIVLSSHVFRKQQRKPVNATKLKNMITGKTTEYSFHVSEKAEEADIKTKEVKYLYNNKGEWWFAEIKDASKRFKIDSVIVGDAGRFLKDNTTISVVLFDDGEDDEGGKIIGVKLPIKVELKVTEAPPAVKGDTAKGGNKVITVETGATVLAPLFINQGDIVSINTETGQYSERVS
ncbi:MAG: elongation factor P [Minisyncoccia bacterium]